MATYEIQCHGTMGDAIFFETSERKAMRRARAYAEQAEQIPARVDVKRAEWAADGTGYALRIGGYHLGADGKVRRVS